MRWNPPRRQEQQRRLTAYLTDERVPAQERGWITVALVGHAAVYVLLAAAESAWIIGTAVRVWRRREAGLGSALRTGVHRPTAVILLGANLLYAILRRLGLAGLDRRSAGQPPGTSEQ
jgi:hypothetical protein